MKNTNKTLFFENSFWCKELDKGFRSGIYQPKDVKEYNILAKYAGIELMEEPTKQTIIIDAKKR